MDIFVIFKKYNNDQNHKEIVVKQNKFKIKNKFLFFIYTSRNVFVIGTGSTKNKCKNANFLHLNKDSSNEEIMESIIVKNFLLTLEKKCWFFEDEVLKKSRYKSAFKRYIKRIYSKNEPLFWRFKRFIDVEMLLNKKIDYILDNKTVQIKKKNCIPVIEDEYFIEKQKINKYFYEFRTKNTPPQEDKTNFFLKFSSYEHDYSLGSTDVTDNSKYMDYTYLCSDENKEVVNDYTSFVANHKYTNHKKKHSFKIINPFYKIQKKKVYRNYIYKELVFCKNFDEMDDESNIFDMSIYDYNIFLMAYVNANIKKKKQTTQLSESLKLFIFYTLMKNYYQFSEIKYSDIINRKIVKYDLKIELNNEIDKTEKKSLKEMQENVHDNLVILIQRLMLNKKYKNFKGSIRYLLDKSLLALLIKKNVKHIKKNHSLTIFKNEDSNLLTSIENNNLSIFFLKKKTKYENLKKKYVVLHNSVMNNHIFTLSQIFNNLNYKFSYFIEINKVEMGIQHIYNYLYEHFSIELKHKYIKNFPLIEFTIKLSFLIVTKNANSFIEILSNIMYTQPIKGQKILVELLDSFEEHNILAEIIKYKIVGLWMKFSGKIAVKAGDRAASHIIKFGMYSRNKKLVKTQYNEEILKTNGGAIGFKCYIFYE